MWNSSQESYRRDDFDERRYDFDRVRNDEFHGHRHHDWHWGHGYHQRWDWDGRGYEGGYEHSCHGYDTDYGNHGGYHHQPIIFHS